MTRRRGIAALTGLLVLGAMASGLADRWPEALRAMAALAVLLALPAFLFARTRRASDAAARRPALHLSIALLAWLCVLATWTTAFALAHASFRAYAVASTWLLVGGLGASAAWSLRRADGVSARAIPRRWWVLAAACALFAAAVPFHFGVGEDGLDHAGYVRRILTDDTLRPAGVLVLPAGENAHAWPDPRKGALHGVFALACWISSADPLVVWRWIPLVMFPAAVLALFALNEAFLAARAARVAAAVLALLCFDGNPFRFAAASAHGESMAALWCWGLTAAAVAGPRAARWPLWMLLAAGGVLVHLGVAVHVLVLAATIVCLGGAWGIAPRERLRVSIPMFAGVLIAIALRHDDLAGGVNVIHAHTQGVLFLGDRWFVASPMEILRQHGMIFLGGIVCVGALMLAARAHGDARRILAAAAIPFAVSFIPWIATRLYANGSYMVFRSLLQVPVFAAIVACAVILGGAVRRRDRRACFVGIPAAVVWLAVFFRPVPFAIANDLRARTGTGGGVEFPSPALVRAVAGLPEGSVVLSDPATSYVLSAHTAQRFVAVYQQHGNPRDPIALDRIRAVRDVLSPYVMPDVAVAACRRFGVNYVVVNDAPPRDTSEFLSIWRPQSLPATLARMNAMAGAFEAVERVDGAHIYRFHAAAPARYMWAAQDQPVAVGAPPLEPCEIAAPRDAFHITGISVLPARALPGDTVRVTLGYVRDAPLPFQMPVIVHVRFDHEVLAQGHAFPGEKQWRRLRDGREGVRSRFREDLRPGHGDYEPDLWPVGFDLCETFAVVVPRSARRGRYRVEVSIASLPHVPNFHVRDLLFNRDHYSGRACASVDVVDRVVGAGEGP